jgi:hypothetical protein
MMPSWSFLTRAKDDMSVWRAQWVDHPSVTWISRVQSLLEGRIFVFFSQRLERPKIEGKGKEETGNYQSNCKPPMSRILILMGWSHRLIISDVWHSFVRTSCHTEIMSSFHGPKSDMIQTFGYERPQSGQPAVDFWQKT